MTSDNSVSKGNPYRYDAPIRTPQDFFGRDLELQHVQEAIERKACVSFVGGPQSGLSSLLYHIVGDAFRTRCESSCGDLVFVHVDCAAIGDDPLALIEYLLTEIGSPTKGLSHWRMAFGRLVAAVDRLQPTRLLIAFDDFECIGRHEAYADLTDHLRALGQRSDMTLVTATHTELKNCCHMKVVSSPFPNMFHVEYLSAFTQPEATHFVETMSGRSGINLGPLCDQILALSGRHPYYLQMACAKYYDAVLAGDSDAAGAPQEFLAVARRSFDDIWARLTMDEQRSLLALALETGVQKDPIEIPPGLLRRGYVQREGRSGRPRIFSQAFQDYVRNRS